jgi:pimeloyl-ACP methyl ester carboxylesterase
LSEPENRRSFIRTLRSVVDVGGQTVNASDRLYLAAAVPTLIIWGDKDAIIPVKNGYAAHLAIPGSRLEVLPDIGHFPQSEDPQRFIEVLTDFMATTEPAHAGAGRLRRLLSEGA